MILGCREGVAGAFEAFRGVLEAVRGLELILKAVAKWRTAERCAEVRQLERGGGVAAFYEREEQKAFLKMPARPDERCYLSFSALHAARATNRRATRTPTRTESAVRHAPPEAYIVRGHVARSGASVSCGAPSAARFGCVSAVRFALRRL